MPFQNGLLKQISQRGDRLMPRPKLGDHFNPSLGIELHVIKPLVVIQSRMIDHLDWTNVVVKCL